MKEIGRYDTDLQMFVEAPKPIDRGKLKFMRFIAEREGRTLSEPVGLLALTDAILPPKTLTITKKYKHIVQGD